MYVFIDKYINVCTTSRYLLEKEYIQISSKLAMNLLKP